MGLPAKKSKKAEIYEVIQNLHSTHKALFIRVMKENKGLIQQLMSVEETVPESIKEKTIEEGIEEFFRSVHFTSGLAESSKITYRSEASSFLKYCDSQKKLLPLGRSEKIGVLLKKPIVFLQYTEKIDNVYTRNKKNSFLRSFLKIVCKKELLKADLNISRVLPIIDKDDDEPKALSQVQAKELVALSKQGTNNFRNHALLWVLLGSGIRVGEFYALQVKDIIPETQHLMVNSEKQRVANSPKVKRKINFAALEILMDYVDFTYGHLKDSPYFGEIYVFSKTRGSSPLSQRMIQNIVKDLINRSQTIPEADKHYYSTHSLRHTFSISLLEKGVDIYTISKLLGHKSLKSTEVYLKLFDYTLQEAIEKLPFSDVDLKELKGGK